MSNYRYKIDDVITQSQILDRFEILQQLGAGGLASVYKVRDHLIDHEVFALKVFDQADNDLDLLKREYEILSALSSSYARIPQVFDVGELKTPDQEPQRGVGDRLYYLKMEYIEGQRLTLQIADGVSLAEAYQITAQLLEALIFLHNHDVLHRDIKPDNIIMAGERGLVLVDFNISKKLENDDGSHTQVGTPRYKPPEIVTGGAWTFRSDLYGVGLVLYELITGRYPFKIGQDRSASQPPRNPQEINSQISDSLAEATLKAIAERPEERFESAEQMLDHLKKADWGFELSDEDQNQQIGQIGHLFKARQPANKNNKRATALPPANLPCPYKGLEAFEIEDAAYFFGRDGLIAEMIARLQKMSREPASTRLLAVIGSSGNGKSSLVRAGLMPAVKQGKLPDSQRWQRLFLTPTQDPLESLALSMVSGLSGLHGKLASALLNELEADPRALRLTIKQAQRENPEAGRVLLVVDQFEEVFTQCRDEKKRRRFIEALLESATHPESDTIVILTLRADFYGHCANYNPLAEQLPDHQLLVGTLQEEQLRQVIEEPAAKAGLRIEQELLEMIIRDVAEAPGVLPMLSHTLRETWQNRTGNTLTVSGYQKTGGVQGAIAQTANKVYESLSAEQQKIARHIFLRLTEIGEEGTLDTRRRVPRKELIFYPDAVEEIDFVLNKLTNTRLLTGGLYTIEVAHEALIREWPTLQNWLDEDRQGLRLHRRLTESANEWSRANRDPSMLYRGTRLSLVNQFAEKHHHALNELERQFITESNAQQKSQLEREQQRSRYWSALSLALGLFVVIALVVAGVALNQQAIAQKAKTDLEAQLTLSEAQRLAFAAQTQLELASERALLLAYEAVARSHNTETEQILRDALDRMTWKPTTLSPPGHKISYQSATFSPDGQYIFVAFRDNNMGQLWDTTGQSLATFSGHSAPIKKVVFSADGQHILTISEDHTARLWDLSGQQLAILSGHTAPITKVVFSANGQQILTASEDHTARLWDLSGQQLVLFSGHTKTVNSVVFSPDNQRILTGSEDRTARLWDLSGQTLVTFSGHTKGVSAMFTGDGQHIFTRSVIILNEARIWDLNGKLIRDRNFIKLIPNAPHILTTDSKGDTQVEDLNGQILATLTGSKPLLSPDGQYVLTNSSSEGIGKTSLWNLSGQELATFTGGRLGFSSDGEFVFTTSHLKNVVVWNLSGELIGVINGKKLNIQMSWVGFSKSYNKVAIISRPTQLWDLTGQLLLTVSGYSDDDYTTLVFSPDGQHILSRHSDGAVRLWNQATELLITFSGNEVQFSPDGPHFLTQDVDKRTVLWDLSGQQLATFNESEARFSPDGQYILTADVNSTMWDLSGQKIATFNGSDPQLSPDGQHILTSINNKALLWNLSGARLATFNGSDSLFSPNGQHIFTKIDRSTWSLWDLSGEQIFTLKGSEPQFSPAGQHILTRVGSVTAQMWDLKGRPVAIFGSDTDHIVSTAFTSDGQHILVGFYDKTVRMFDLTGQQLITFRGRTLLAHDILSSPDGQHFLTIEEGQTVRLWDLTGKEVFKINNRSNKPFTNWAFTPDGRRLLLATEGSVQQYRVYIEDVLAVAACHVGRGLTEEEIERFGVGTPRFVFEERQCPPSFSWEKDSPPTPVTTHTPPIRAPIPYPAPTQVPDPTSYPEPTPLTYPEP